MALSALKSEPSASSSVSTEDVVSDFLCLMMPPRCEPGSSFMPPLTSSTSSNASQTVTELWGVIGQ